MRLRPWTLSVALILLSTTAGAAEPRIVFVAGQGVSAGDVVEVGWQGLPAHADEFEFLLSTGQGELVRLTPELSPSDGSFQWTVPDLPSREAVLVLRAGIDALWRHRDHARRTRRRLSGDAARTRRRRRRSRERAEHRQLLVSRLRRRAALRETDGLRRNPRRAGRQPGP